jgi:flavin reductase (DIM6/NTAB) family NADH-FMN oxidoreductase RutF
MTTFKDFSARFAQNVCILTHAELGIERSCTISSYSSVSASASVNYFSFSLAQNSFMAGIVGENSKVKVTLLSHGQRKVAEFYVRNRFDSEQFNINRVCAESNGFVTGRVTGHLIVGGSILYLAQVQEVALNPEISMPLIYRLRNYDY